MQSRLKTIQLVKKNRDQTPRRWRPAVGVVRHPPQPAPRAPTPRCSASGSQTKSSLPCISKWQTHTPHPKPRHTRKGVYDPGAHLLREPWMRRMTRGASARLRSFVAKCFPGRSWPSPRKNLWVWSCYLLLCWGREFPEPPPGRGGEKAGHSTQIHSSPMSPRPSRSPITGNPPGFLSQPRCSAPFPEPEPCNAGCRSGSLGSRRTWRIYVSTLGFIGP